MKCILYKLYSLEGNFSDKDLQPPLLSVKLVPGDLLYFPRGFIHQVC